MLDKAEQILGYRFQNKAILDEALTHASVAGHRLESNERLEFLGDAILGYVVSAYLYQHFPDDLEGELTKIKSAVVSRRSCARITSEIGLDSMLSLGKGMTNRPTVPSSVSAAVLEAIIAAIYLDGGMEPAQRFILEHMTALIDEAAASAHQQNFKSLLQQHAQQMWPTNPTYVLLDEKGPDHDKCFEVCVQINGKRYAGAWAGSKKEAEQKAALLALEELGLVRVDQKGQVHVTDACLGQG